MLELSPGIQLADRFSLERRLGGGGEAETWLAKDRLTGSARLEPVGYDVVMEAMCEYAAQHIAGGGRLNQVTRHMIGLFQGVPGARRYRQILSVKSVKPQAGPDVIREAFAAVMPNLQRAA